MFRYRIYFAYEKALEQADLPDKSLWEDFERWAVQKDVPSHYVIEDSVSGRKVAFNFEHVSKIVFEPIDAGMAGSPAMKGRLLS